MKGKELKYHKKLQDGISMGLSRRRKKKISKKHNKSGRIRAQRDPFWMRRALKRIHRRKLSGCSGISLIILIGAAERLRFARDLRGGGRRRLRKTERFWDRSREQA